MRTSGSRHEGLDGASTHPPVLAELGQSRRELRTPLFGDTEAAILPTMSADADRGFLPYLRMLTYPIIFAANPCERVEHAFEVMARDAPEYIPDAFIRAIDQGLESQVKLSDLTGMHSEEAIRSYLLAMRNRLRQSFRAEPSR
jgi:hypothetical protein